MGGYGEERREVEGKDELTRGWTRGGGSGSKGGGYGGVNFIHTITKTLTTLHFFIDVYTFFLTTTSFQALRDAYNTKQIMDCPSYLMIELIDFDLL